ncbi:heat-inducible transcriptional repressor HrcA [Amantichitinum ursilacus]|uniref:Heat-inducible transcription repressor HrcA n=1 Tax=Amantichitinum ursilacus TaxID=857265 RepID=A0A0N0GQX5_9NEIS|nr:heat-inducible transcriptional repressor HrcA [Amantichitinum ursilacus]KPC55141.1 Heat-inducible transcription repressor HrcA [Amantichitinum ursilacus]
MLSDRAQILLKTLVERYIADGQPVGSKALSHYSGLDISSATIRNVMVDLEQLGFVASPHTSAGRIPTSLGYRFFVDSLLSVQQLHADKLQPLSNGLPVDNPQRTITAASQLLSQLTHFAGVVLTPRRQDVLLKHIEFLPLSDRRVLLILVTSDGDVQNRIIQTNSLFSQSELSEAANFLNAHCTGRTWHNLRQVVENEVRAVKGELAALLNTAVVYSQDVLSGDTENLVISGERNLLDSDDLAANMGRLRQLFELFERKTALLQLMEAGNRAEGVKIFIGGESGLAPLDDCSIITAPYHANGEVIGTLGVIGPTRMAYERIIPIVDVTARLLSSALSQ